MIWVGMRGGMGWLYIWGVGWCELGWSVVWAGIEGESWCGLS